MRPRIRRFTLCVLVCTLAISAGCSVIATNGDSPTSLAITNQDNTGHAVVVEIADGERLAYSEGRIMEGESSTEIDAFNETGKYHVRVAVDGSTTTKTFTFEGDDPLTIGIDNSGNVTLST